MKEMHVKPYNVSKIRSGGKVTALLTIKPHDKRTKFNLLLKFQISQIQYIG